MNMILALLFLALLSHGQENSLPAVKDFHQDLPTILYGTMNAGKALDDQLRARFGALIKLPRVGMGW